MGPLAICAQFPMSLFRQMFFTKSKWTLAFGVCSLLISGSSAAEAQTAFLGAQTVLAAGYGGPAGVAVDKLGNLYISEYDGSTIDEIQASNGVVSASSPIRVLTHCSDDCQGIAVDASGDVYFVDGASVKEMIAVNGTIPTTPTIRILASGFMLPQAIAIDPSNDLFVGDYYTGVISEIVAVNGSIPASPSIIAIASGFNGVEGMALDRLGNLYFTDFGTLEEILAVNGAIPVSPTVVTVPGGTGANRGVAVDSSGNVYFSDDNDNVVREILAVGGSIPAAPTVITLASQGLDAADGVAVDQRGNVYIANIGFSQVIEVSPAQNFYAVNVGSTSATASLHITFPAQTTVGGIKVLTAGAAGLDFANTGTGSCTLNINYGAGQGCTVNVNFTPRLSGMRFGAAILLDANGNAIAKTDLVGTGVAPQLSFAPGKPTVLGSGFSQPSAAAIDGAGDVFVADNATHSVMEIVAVNGVIPPSPTIKLLGSSQTYPSGIAVDGSGNLIVASSSQSAVYELTSASGYSSILSLGGGFNLPKDVAVDGLGNLFVADSGSNTIKKIPPGCFTTDCVVALGNGLQGPTSVALDGAGNIFVVDAGDSAIKEITASSGYQTTQTVLSSVPSRYGLAVDAAGDLYLSNQSANSVEEFLASSGYAETATIADGFNSPRHIALSANGNLLVADAGNNQVVQLDLADAPVLNFAPTPAGTTSPDSPQTVTLSNVGNADLTFPIFGANNPSISSNFSLNSGGASACPVVSSTSFQAGTLASGSSCTLSVLFIPASGGTFAGSLALTDNNLNAAAPNYSTQSVVLNGTGQLTPTITWHAPAAITYGTPLGAAQLNATANVLGTFAYSPASGVVLAAGTQTLSVTFTPTDTAHYTTATTTVQLIVNKATPVITWPKPAAITYGTPLGAAQLDATANVPGTFSYAPSAGTILPVGNDTLNVTFTPTDTNDYNSAATSVVLTVNAAPSFSLSASPASVSLKQTASATSTITVSAAGGFTGSVTLSASGLPSGVSVSYSVNPVTKSSVLTFKASGNAAIGTSTVIVAGKSGSLLNTTSIALTITPKK